jgi:transcriptional/translational regulatory protein YebC/TACO1
VRDAMQKAGLRPEHAEITLRADNQIAISGEHAEQVSDLLEWLEELDDVQDVYSNAALPRA